MTKLLNLYKARAALESIVIAFIKKEFINTPTYGSWYTEEGVYFERQMGEEPIFKSWETLEAWAEKNYADAV